jgi:DNA-directed RNA polymerase subunit alpha
MITIPLPQKPKYVLTDEKSGKIIIEGCYPGYGTTLGNALRRVLLSSLDGSAIVSAKIKGVKHEFSTIPNVKEDVIQIILNLKQVRFKLDRDESAKVSLVVKGEKKVTASMIKCPSGVEVINKEALIATITNAKGEIEIELEIAKGIGYVPVEMQERENKEVGVIAIDAIYTPVRRVNYIVENMRVGKKTDFERINLDIETDGTVSPEASFEKAVKILVDQFSILLEIDKEKKAEEIEPEEKEEVEKVEKKEDKSDDARKVEVTSLKNLSTRTLNVLEKNKIETIGDVVKMNEEQVGNLEGMGAKGIKEIKKAIGDYGLNLKKKE